MIPDYLKGKETKMHNSTGYSLEYLKNNFEIREIAEHVYMLLKWDAEKIWLDFAFFDFLISDFDYKNMFVECVFHGCGPTGALRECRHTYWGEEGYIFYPKKRVIKAALKALEEFYDLD